MSSDAELLNAWREGDRTAGASLFSRHYASIARFFRNKVGDGDSADLIQKTFLACVETRERFRGDASFRTYLFAVARNVLGKHYRSRRRHGDRLDFGVTSVHDLAPSPTQVLARSSEQRLLLQGLRRIPLDAQVILELYFWESMKAAEIAAVLEVPEGTARTRIRRAKQLLAAELEALGSASLESTQTRLDDWARELRDQLLESGE
ncbi:MAG: sigma-70 family RNA polymerase sigma factor [Nannocystaceae bacterium]|nr:sigma-70 family RNA polymerase sigma factor [Myxococcales bacterium]